ncbi:LysM peptidoglycan-binding domain-containing protein [Longimicrobium sp.]|uniref:LysM peptidoglycan-binding domain-containing protein n=1 Tax=Longimicrobium sp. TaxID=2029185 RepID=UPI002E2F761B|nr:LysM peptidoglycan-binding domain-containing protein [Longimicrobium sp.]HEX6039082.1 LysM peptidoglycan-binding domain-containing protein [Longimicrobium sp.]
MILDSQAKTKDAALHAFTNCAVVADNIDTTVTNVFVQPATYTVVANDSFTSAAASFNAAWGTQYTPAQVAGFNAAVPLLLIPGAALALPSGGTYTIGYNDTFASIAAAQGTDVDTLLAAGTNATAPILSPGAQMQLAPGVLRPQATVDPGMVGFEATRTNPDPDNLPYDQLTPAQTVGTLFNLVGWSVDGGSAFLPSGAGLPTTPADSLQAGTDGLSAQDVDDQPALEWFYQQTLAVAPFATAHNGSASPALPPASANPYNGVGYDSALGTVNQVVVDLDLQDIYGNLQPVPAAFSPVHVPVGYFDDLVALPAWPSLAVGYTVQGSPAALSLSLSMQQSRYVPAPATAVDSALAAIQADLTSYTRIVYQLSQPDVRFSLGTTLDSGSLTAAGRYPLPAHAFASWANGAWIYLDALSALQAIAVEGDGTTTVQAVADAYGLAPAQLFAANQARTVVSLFGAGETLTVPQMYAVLQGDTLGGIATSPRWSSFGLTAASLAQQNASVPLMAATDLVSAPRTADASSTDSFSTAAARAHAAVEAIATAIAPTPGFLAPGVVLTVGTATYTTTAQDTLASAAAALAASAAQVAVANQYIVGLFPDGTTLPVRDVLIAEGDTFASLAALLGTDVGSLATLNASTANVFAPATPLYIGANPSPVAPGPDDSLAAWAAENAVTPDQLGTANPAAAFAPGASVSIPGVLASPGGGYATYAALASDTLGGIAGRYGAQASALATLNPDLPGLLLGGQTVTDTASGKSVPTQDGDTFQTLVARFAGIGVTVDVGTLGTDVAGQQGLLAPGGSWITPAMRGDGGGANGDGTLSGLAAAYGTDVATLAAGNAALRGLLAPGISLPLGSPALVTGPNETLNSVANRLALQGAQTPVADVAQALADVKGLVPANAPVLPVPPASPPGLAVTLKPSFTAPVFSLAVNVYTTRDPQWIDPDFADVATVAQAVSPVSPEPDAAGTLTFVEFATALQAALPGLNVATGSPLAEDDDESAATFWVANFGNGAGPIVTYQFEGTGTVCYAIPPLSTSLMAGSVNVAPYTSGTGLGDTPQPRTFQAVDLDVWLNTFLEAVDVFLAPATAVPAFAGDAASDPAQRAVVRIVEDKRRLATSLSDRVMPILQGGPDGSLPDAQGAMFQALLTSLSSAFTVSSLVQVPVTVTGGSGTTLSAPRISGKLTASGAGTGDDGQPSAYSFSTAKVSLLSGATATFLFSVKAPAEHRQAQLTLDYVVNELEMPDPSSVIGDYEGSEWLTFILPLDDAHGEIGAVDIPIPLRAYPGPATLVAQAARQTVDDPSTAAELLGWDFGFVYQHDDAEQDTPMVVVGFNGDPTATVTGVGNDAVLTAVFGALAQFMAVYPALKDDLALLPLMNPGTPSPTTQAAVQTLATLVGGVADAFEAMTFAAIFVPPVETYAYQMQKEQDAQGNLTQLLVTSVDPHTGQPQANPVALWPSVYATIAGSEVQLAAAGAPGSTQAAYTYPANVSASAALPQRFVFAWPGGEADTDPAAWPPLPPTLQLPGPQTYAFTGVNPLTRQSGRAGVSIARNLSLIQGVATADAFVYRTPLTSFASSVAPLVTGSDPIAIGADPTPIAQALGTFLQALFTSENSWSAGDQVNVRLAASYAYPIAAGGLPVLVPVLLVPGFLFAPQTDWDWTQAASFVSQVQAGVLGWATGQPLIPAGSYVFDLTVYASQGLLQPLIRATTLQYERSSS